MEILICENNLVGFLTAVYKHYYEFKNAEIITSSAGKATMMDSCIETAADEDLARKVRNGIIEKIGRAGYDDVANSYLNSHSDKEQYIFRYLKLVFKYGQRATFMYDNADVINFNDLKRKVWHETGRLLGFVRLQEMESGVYYGYFKSDHDVLELLMRDMKIRFNTQKFVLHDVGRGKMIFFDGINCHKMLAPKELEVNISEKEAQFQSLWKLYFNTVAIEDRKNHKLQQQFLPKKYRFFMNEF